eukprot:1600642-Karenia_brevis.AAC.1
MTPAMMLGPQCNHDLGILLRVGRNSSAEQSHGKTLAGQSQESQVASHEAARNAMLEAMGDN